MAHPAIPAPPAAGLHSPAPTDPAALDGALPPLAPKCRMMGLLDGGNDRNTLACLELIKAGDVRWDGRTLRSPSGSGVQFAKLSTRLYHRVGWESTRGFGDGHGPVELTTEGRAMLEDLR